MICGSVKVTKSNYNSICLWTEHMKSFFKFISFRKLKYTCRTLTLTDNLACCFFFFSVFCLKTNFCSLKKMNLTQNERKRFVRKVKKIICHNAQRINQKWSTHIFEMKAFYVLILIKMVIKQDERLYFWTEYMFYVWLLIFECIRFQNFSPPNAVTWIKSSPCVYTFRYPGDGF